MTESKHETKQKRQKGNEIDCRLDANTTERNAFFYEFKNYSSKDLFLSDMFCCQLFVVLQVKTKMRKRWKSLYFSHIEPAVMSQRPKIRS